MAFVGTSDSYFETAVVGSLMTNLAAIAARLKALRKSLPGKPTQEELAATIGISRSAIAGIESGGDRGGISTMVALADYYKVPLDWLLCRKVPAGGPLVGKFVDDPDELALVRFWGGLTDDERTAMLRLLQIRRADTA